VCDKSRLSHCAVKVLPNKDAPMVTRTRDCRSLRVARAASMNKTRRENRNPGAAMLEGVWPDSGGRKTRDFSYGNEFGNESLFLFSLPGCR
jgi:hypothetical protein